MNYIDKGEYILDGNIAIPKNENNRDYNKILKEVLEGESFIIKYVQSVSELRKEVIHSIKREAIRRIGDIVNAVPELDMTESAIFTYQHAWPPSNPSQALLDGKATYDFAVSRLQIARTAERSTLENYDVTQDTWP